MTAFILRPACRISAAAVALVFAATALSGCDHLMGDRSADLGAGEIVIDPTQRHPILVSEKPHKLNLRIARGERGLAPAQRASVIDFLYRARNSDGGNSKLAIAVPTGSANEISAMAAVADIRPLIADAGFSESAVSIQPYYADGDPQPPVRLTFVHFVAEGPECGKWTENLAETSRNLNYADFGCTQQKNLAAMVANPADLIGPRTMTPANADRRDTTYGKYIKGDSPGASRTSDERAAN